MNMSEDNKARAQEFYAAINSGNLGIVDSHVADNFVNHEEFPTMPPTKEGVRQFFAMMRTSFPDFNMTIEHIVAEGDMIAIHAVMHGTHRGEFMGIAPTSKQIAVPFFDLLRVTGGKAVEHWGVTDTTTMMQQLGISQQ
jgi:steroid delta-isomerase-like uncharacterized protein